MEKNSSIGNKEEAHNKEGITGAKKIDIFPDPVRQHKTGSNLAPPIAINFDGLGPMDETCTNPDTQGDVGLNHYMQMIKRSFAIWDKEGSLLYGPASNKTLWSTLPGPWLDYWFTDPIVLYDHLEDRWLASNMVYEIEEEYLYWEVIAVSATPDPLGEWYCYAFEHPFMPDYPKFGVWDDEYVMSINDFDIEGGLGTFKGSEIWAINKVDLLNGEPEPATIVFITDEGNGDVRQTPSCWLPSDLDGVPLDTDKPNYLVYVKDNEWGFNNDHLSLWELNTDWDNPENSSFEEVQVIEVEPFTADYNNWYAITQPNTSFKISSMIDRLMYRLQYRKFENYEMLITNHTVNVDTNFLTGVRWYELRNYGEGWTLHQQGTYSPDENHRWMGSISMDNRGNIAAGYSVSSDEVYPSIRMTGRCDTDELGIMSLEEIEVVTGAGYQTQNWRWGDYSCMSIDPADDQTFWYTQMYMPETGQLEWETKICAVKIAKELSFNIDTLKFETLVECLEGKVLTIKNNAWDEIVINEIVQEGYVQGTMWYVDELPVSLPYTLPQGDSINLLIRVDFITNQFYNGFVYDEMAITANTTYNYNIIMAINEDFTYNAPEENSAERKISIFPNPFNDETNVLIKLEKNAKVNIEILDQNQVLICSLIKNKKLKDGHYTFKWNRLDNMNNKVPAGVYFCIITLNREAYIKKVIIN